MTVDVQPVGTERRRQLVEAALGILEAEGPDGLTMRSLAERGTFLVTLPGPGLSG